MGWTRRWRKRLRALVRREAVERELDEELALHLELETEKNLGAGMSPEEARRRAAIAFGPAEKHKEEVRDARKLGWLTGLSLDLKLGLRMLARNPGITVIGALGMAVGIAISAAVFSLIGTMLDPALPLDEGDRIVALVNLDVKTDGEARQTHLHDLATWREELTAVGELGAYRAQNRNLVTPGDLAETVRVAEMTASGFRVARVPPRLGRWLDDADEREGAPAVVVIGNRVWRDRFASDPEVVGRTLRLGGEPHTIVGVMPEGFAFPVNNSLWTPLRLDPLDHEPGRAPPIDVFGRLAAGATLEQAQAQLATVGARLAAGRPEGLERVRPVVIPYAHAFVDGAEIVLPMQILRLGVGILLMVIAANVAVLVYARTATRTGEIAIRTALGASRRRVVGQLFAEALVLCSVAAALGLLMARVVLGQIAVFLDLFGGEQLPYWWRVELSPGTVGYVAVLAVVGAAIIGVLPGLRATGRRTQATLRDVSGSTAMRLGRTWTLLIALQVATAVALMPFGAALPLLRLVNARAPAPPVPLEEIHSAQIALDEETPAAAEAAAYERARLARFADRTAELTRRLAAEPGVRAAAFASSPPGADNHRTLHVDQEGPTTALPSYLSKWLEVDPGLFDLFGVKVLAGRAFQPADLAEGSTAVIVNRSFAEWVFGVDAPALGRRFRYPGEGVGPAGVAAGDWYEIVGLVEDFPGPGRSAQDAATIYHPVAAPRDPFATVLVHAPGARPDAIAARLREITASVDPALRLAEVETVAGYLRLLRMPERMIETALLGLVGSVLLLSAAGVHALVSLTVTQRRREIGIRVALGARPLQVLRGVVSRALRQIALGLGAGVVLAGLLIPAITTSQTRAALLLAVVGGVMLIVGLFSVVGPARRGLRIQPMEALREE